ncbi:MAG: GGDEF domain-containing protein [Burkholderiales bacterium]|nr:GGDEF domain-containing protein [Burkholderiales bacterium]OJX05546.1 MAG: hypothetical protein BGO72_09685 [Burkholderiales bacterium 70-64]
MNNESRGAAGASTAGAAHPLALADAALERGEPERSRSLAMLASRMASAAGDLRLEAHAQLLLARADALVSRLRSAHQAAHRAAHLYQALDDPAGEVRSLARLAHAASCLRHNEAALSAALLATKLAESLPLSPLRVSAFDSLGIALTANGDFEQSERALATAIDIAGELGDVAAGWPPRLDRCYGEIVRLTVERHLDGRAPDPGRLAGFLAECRAQRRPGEMPRPAAGLEPTFNALLAFAECFAACWQGERAAARAQSEEVLRWAARYARVTWLRSLGMWARCEVAWAERDWALAESCARQMIELAIAVEHEQLVRTGYMLSSQILGAQDRSGEALEALRLLAQRDLDIRRESFAHHERVAQWQIDLRASFSQLHRLQARSRHLEQLSLEDALTGLPNRRRFERELSEALALLPRYPQGVSIALIDVDRFKSINDRYSHVAGDLVLKAIAGLLRAHVRQDDLPARLAGDEFVILFRGADLAAATRVCRRLVQAVACHAWGEIGSGLAVSLSVGLAQAHASDTVESLLGRSDSDMYRAKAQGRAESGTAADARDP